MFHHLLRRRLLLAASTFAAVLPSFVPQLAPAQVYSGTTAQGLPTTQTDTNLYTLSGTVVNSVTGEPVIRALVQVMGQSAPRAQFTDREGRFQFTKMQAMTGNLRAVKPGFYGNDQAGRQQMANQRVTVGPEMAPLVIKLVPESGIAGQITDANGEALENVRVGVTANVIQNGRRVQQRMQQTQSDEQGEFQLLNLPPGKYFLSAGPVWNSSAESKTGFAAQYFPGVSESSEATPIDVLPGQTVHADVSLPPAKIFHISGVITGSEPGYPQIVNQSGDQAGTMEVYDQNTGKFSAKVTCTVCTIKARAGDPRTEFEYGEQTLTLNEDKRDVHVAMSPLSVPVKVTQESSKPDFVSAEGQAVTASTGRGRPGRLAARNGQVFLRLISLSKLHNDAYSGFGGSPDNPDMFLQNVEFGKYVVEVNASGGGWYVASVTYGATNLDNDPIDIEAGPSQPIEIVLKDDVASMSGTVTGNDDANQSATVIVVPARASARIRTFPVTGDGTFQANNLAPGQYKIYCFDSIKDLEYANPEAMKQYSGSATDLSLDPNGTGSVTVQMIKRAE